MERNEFKFKTSLNCGGCVSKVKPALDAEEGILSWSVDTDNPDKVLTIQRNGISLEEVVNIVKSRGFKIEQI